MVDFNFDGRIDALEFALTEELLAADKEETMLSTSRGATEKAFYQQNSDEDNDPDDTDEDSMEDDDSTEDGDGLFADECDGDVGDVLW